MINLFYSIGIFIVLLNVASLIQYKKIFDITEWISKYKLVTGKNPIVENFRNKSDHDILLFWSFTVVSTVMWMLFGLLGDQWVVFLFILMLNIILNTTKYLCKKRKIRVLLILIKSSVGLLVITFLMLNHFFFNLDLMWVLFGHH